MKEWFKEMKVMLIFLGFAIVLLTFLGILVVKDEISDDPRYEITTPDGSVYRARGIRHYSSGIDFRDVATNRRVQIGGSYTIKEIK